MLYDLKLTITYTYDSPAATGRHILRLTPLDLGPEQRVIASTLTVGPQPTEWRAGIDFFGNQTVAIYIDAPHEELVVRLQARVRREAAAAFLDMSPPVPILAQEVDGWLGVAPGAPHHFVGPSPRVPLDPVMTEWAERVVVGAGTPCEALRMVGEALHSEMRFEAGATEVDTAPREAFDARRGVCQDFSHIMIACLRGIGIPAGYVSGFLRTEPPPGKERLEGADAMHAWVRAWCGREMGWVAYDPTNAMPEGEDHIVSGYGRDYADVAPIRGVSRTFGGHETTQAVDVIPLD
jgi:transglutaminase-like putative cysteine protease